MILNKCGCGTNKYHDLVKVVQSNGKELYGFQCMQCKKMIGHWLKHADALNLVKVMGITLEELLSKKE